ncbi:2-hydroxyacid dehydrogenase [Sphingobium sp. CR2-8]|uniref:2-hydroxyacid dehydrogenase n=1 Tax=Sphingobium sp. CR2-8 TaxID=1306534 RepID=UPI002DBFE0F8|nr:2-hydroxyacid dehydrogenase [Sphingobium sp. CR2-8]MEC3910004.1 2-hydroxyacid dehydrogenase [Sphingobium sp. CR2-8]
MDTMIALQLCPLSDHLEVQLASRCHVQRWFEMDDAAQRAWLADKASSVGLVVTGGQLGCDNDLIAALPSLRLIAINGVGYDKVDVALAQSRGVDVSTTPNVLTDDVADLAVGLVIGLLRGLPRADRFVRTGGWTDRTFPLGRKVSGRRFGIVGLGRIGQAIAHRLSAFGDVAYYGRSAKDVPYRFEPELAALARASDILVLACAANDATYKLIDADILKALGADGYLVNVARGSVVDEDALIAALDSGGIAGAALDVFADEPAVPAALLGNDRTLLTPHIASATVETRIAMADLVLANVDALLAGRRPPTALAR